MRGKAERMICSVGIAFLMSMLFIFFPEQGVTPAAAEGRSDDSVIEISIQKLETVQAAAWQFAAAVPDEVIGFQDNVIRVTAHGKGTVTLNVLQEDGACRYTDSVSVVPGENSMIWRGNGAYGQPLAKGQYQVEVRFAGEDGKQEELTARCSLVNNLQSLLYAVPSSDTLYLNGDEMWSVDCAFVQSGTAVMDVFSSDDPHTLLARISQPVKKETNVRLTWNGRMSSSRFVNVGKYIISVYAEGKPETAYEIPLYVQDSNHLYSESLSIGITGSIVPQRAMSDPEIWEIMMQPSVVYDGTEATYLKEKPSGRSANVGKINPQKQALEVVSVGTDGWTLVRTWRQEDGKKTEGYLLTDRLKIVLPDRQYALLIDKQTQRLCVFEYGKCIAEIPVSTGLVRYGQLSWETPAGSFLTGARLAPAGSEGKTYECRIAYDGSRVIEQVGYETIKGTRRYTDTEKLGQPNTRGGIVIPASADVQENAWWLYTHLRPGTRIIILDEEDTDQPAYNTFESVEPASAFEITMTVCGDAEVGNKEYGQSVWKNNISGFDQLRELFLADDLTVVSLASVIAGRDEVLYSTIKDALRDDGMNLKGAYDADVQLVTLSNRHFSDFGYRGRICTLQSLREAGMHAAGAGSVFIYEKDGYRVGILSDREWSFIENPEITRKDIDALKAQECDVIIALCSWGTEDSGWTTIRQRNMAEYLIAAGADLVIGQSGGMQGVDTIQGIPVLWNLGKIIVADEHPVSYYAAAVRCTLRFSEKGYEGAEISLIPLTVSSSAHEGVNDCTPAILDAEERELVLRMLQRKSSCTLQEKMWFPAPEEK